MEAALHIPPGRAHLIRLRSIWRSAGWPCRDAIELDLLAAGWVTRAQSAGGHETIRLTDAGIRQLANARQRNLRSLSAHDRLAERVAEHLASSGRIVWRELSLRAKVDAPRGEAAAPTGNALWPVDAPDAPAGPRPRGTTAWRMARPDVFSVRHTSVEDYLRPMVHEVKVSRADLLSDLRHAAKRESYRWLSCETYYVFPAGIAEPREVPEAFGVWLLNGPIDSGTLELVRPAVHQPCRLPFMAWMALARATPVRLDDEAAQYPLVDAADSFDALDGEAVPGVPIHSQPGSM